MSRSRQQWRNVSHQRWRNVSDIGKRIGERIRELRVEQPQPRTQEDLARTVGISISYLSLIERGRRVPPMYTLAAIADALEVPLTDLLSGVEEWPNGSREVLRPISDFVLRRQLGSQDVQRLLRVARLMFNREMN